MNRQKITHPEWALKHKRSGAELRFISNHYYLYEVSSVYDKELKRAKKITGPLLGKITQKDGFVPSKKKTVKAEIPVDQPVYCREFGLSRFMIDSANFIVEALKDALPENWQTVLGLAYCRLGWQAPLKNAPFLVNESALKDLLPIEQFNEKNIRSTLTFLGKNRDLLKKYMHKFVQEGAHTLIDATEFFSKSRHISLTKKGYNKDMVFDDQISLLYLYSTNDLMPTFYRLLAGNMREVKAMSLTIKESGVKNAIIIADKGFYSLANVKELEDNNLNFIIPLKRDNKIIKYEPLAQIETKNTYFKYQNRYIYYLTIQIENNTCVLFFDGKLKEQEKTDYLNRIISLPEKFNHDNFLLKLNSFGTIALLTNLKNPNPEDLYTTYKNRANIEQMFDSLKNVLAADCSYMQDDAMLEGWMFINHIALQYYHILYKNLKNQNLLSNYSVSDILLYLKHIKQINIDAQWRTTEVVSKITKVLSKLGVHIT